MRCSCQFCGEYMVQDEKGIESRCICPRCFHTCSACMGTTQLPLDREGLKQMLLRREIYDEEQQQNGSSDDGFSNDPFSED